MTVGIAGEVVGDVPALVQVAQEAAQCRGEILSIGTGFRMTHDEPVGIPGNQHVEGHFPRFEALGEEPMDGGKIFADR